MPLATNAGAIDVATAVVVPIGVAFAFSTSLAIILPPSPLPARVLRSIPLSLAIFLANGLAIILPVFTTGAASCVGAGELLVGAAIGALAFADDDSVFLPAFFIVSKYYTTTHNVKVF